MDKVTQKRLKIKQKKIKFHTQSVRGIRDPVKLGESSTDNETTSRKPLNASYGTSSSLQSTLGELRKLAQKCTKKSSQKPLPNPQKNTNISSECREHTKITASPAPTSSFGEASAVFSPYFQSPNTACVVENTSDMEHTLNDQHFQFVAEGVPNNNDILLQILEKVSKMENRVEVIAVQFEAFKEEMKAAKNKDVERFKGSLLQPPQGFPLSNLEDFDAIENSASVDEIIKAYNHLKGLGGSSLREYLSVGLKMLMTDELICNFTWLGDKKTRKLSDTRVCNVLFMSAQEGGFFPSITKMEFKAELLEVLRASKQRCRNKEAKKNVLVNKGKFCDGADPIDEDVSIETSSSMSSYDDL